MLKPYTTKQTLVSSGAATTGAGTTNVPFNSGNYSSFVAYLNVTAHSGTSPTLDVKFQDSIDGTNFVDVASAAFTQVTTTNGIARLVVSNVGPKCRAVVTLGGTTPSYTLSLDVAGLN